MKPIDGIAQTGSEAWIIHSLVVQLRLQLAHHGVGCFGHAAGHAVFEPACNYVGEDFVFSGAERQLVDLHGQFMRALPGYVVASRQQIDFGSAIFIAGFVAVEDLGFSGHQNEFIQENHDAPDEQ